VKKVQSVADAISWSPDAPGILPTDNGNMFGWNPTTKLWEVRDISISHRNAIYSDIFTISLNGTLNLGVNNNSIVVLNGSATGYTVILPNATTITQGLWYDIYNTTNDTITIKNFGGTILATLAQNSVIHIYLENNSTSNGVWLYWQILLSSVASGVINYNLTSTAPFSTSSASDTIITGFTLTPQAGTYGVWFSADATITTNNNILQFVIFSGGSAVTDSRRNVQGSSSNFRTQLITLAIVQFNGSQACDVRVNSQNANNITINQRSLLLIRLGT